MWEAAFMQICRYNSYMYMNWESDTPFSNTLVERYNSYMCTNWETIQQIMGMVFLPMKFMRMYELRWILWVLLSGIATMKFMRIYELRSLVTQKDFCPQSDEIRTCVWIESKANPSATLSAQIKFMRIYELRWWSRNPCAIPYLMKFIRVYELRLSCKSDKKNERI